MIYVISLACSAALLVLPRIRANPFTQKTIVIREIHHGSSAPLRSITGKSAESWAPQTDAEEDSDENPSAEIAAAGFSDPVRQWQADTALVTRPGLNFLGLGSGFRGPSKSNYPHGVPPDPNAAVGLTQIVETVNLAMAVFDKSTGSVTMGPIFIGNLWLNFDASCSDGGSLADPVVLYDKQANRWIVDIHSLGNPYTICVAVSQTSDATGVYNLYAFGQPGEGNQIAPKLATWPDAYYLSSRTQTGKVYYGPLACAMDRAQMLAGQAATLQCIQINDTSLTEMLPSDMDGPSPPPSGSPNYFLMQGPAGSNALYLYQYHVDFTNPANSTLDGPVEIGVAPYHASIQVPQYGTAEMLNTNGNGLLPRLVYRNFAGATPPYESLLVTHSVHNGSASAKGVGMRWYELRNPGSAPLVYQQGTYAPDANYRWMGSIAMDAMGDIALGYSLSTTSAYPAMAYTGRVPSDPPGTMETEAVLFAGSGNQSDSERWGDYSGMSVDPVDDCTMWYTAQYLTAAGSTNWATRLFSFRFPSCTAANGPKRLP